MGHRGESRWWAVHMSKNVPYVSQNFQHKKAREEAWLLHESVERVRGRAGTTTLGACRPALLTSPCSAPVQADSLLRQACFRNLGLGVLPKVIHFGKKACHTPRAGSPQGLASPFPLKPRAGCYISTTCVLQKALSLTWPPRGAPPSWSFAAYKDPNGGLFPSSLCISGGD